MRNTEISMYIVIAITMYMSFMAKTAFAASDGATGLTWVIATVAWLAYVAMTSCYKVPADKMLASWFFGTSGATFVNGDYAKQKKMVDGKSVGMTGPEMKGGRGLFGTDFVILLRPFWSGTWFPTTAVKMVIPVVKVFLKKAVDQGGKTISHSILVRVNVVILFTLSPNLNSLFGAINVLSRRENDLARDTEIRTLLWNPNDNDNDNHENAYHNPLLAQLCLDALGETVLQAVRAVAGERYIWEDMHGAGDDDATPDLKGAISDFQCEIEEKLARSDSMFNRAGILQEADDQAGRLGESLLFFSLRVESVVPESLDLLEALSAPTIAHMEAVAEKTRGEGEGDRLKEIAKRSGVSTNEALRADVLGKANNLTVGSLGGVGDLIESFFDSKKADETQKPK